MQIGNFINTSELEKIEKIYDMNIVQAESLIPMDATTIMCYVIILLGCVTLDSALLSS